MCYCLPEVPTPTAQPRKSAPPTERPFTWNGHNVLLRVCVAGVAVAAVTLLHALLTTPRGRMQMITVLDYLGGIPELREWYGDTYQFLRNPLAFHSAVDDRPETPVATTRKVWALTSVVPVRSIAVGSSVYVWSRRVCGSRCCRRSSVVRRWSRRSSRS